MAVRQLRDPHEPSLVIDVVEDNKWRAAERKPEPIALGPTSGARSGKRMLREQFTDRRELVG